MPLPPVAGLSPRLHDQVLADFQIPTYLEVLAEAGPRAAALVTSGDVWLDFDTTPATSDSQAAGNRLSLAMLITVQGTTP